MRSEYVVVNRCLRYEKRSYGVKKDLTGNIIKGLATIMVVIGHSWEWMTPYVYTCHLALFFFIAGLHYNEEKYSKLPTSLLEKRIASDWPKFFIYSTLFILLRNSFIDIGFYSVEMQRYSMQESIQRVFSALVFQNSEQMGGAMWFVPMFIINICIFNALFFFVNRYLKPKRIGLWLVFILISILALYIEYSWVQLPYLYHLGLKYLPIAFIGTIISNGKFKIMKYITVVGTISSVFLLWFLINQKGMSNVYMTGNFSFVLMYYPITFLGIYVTLAITKAIKLNSKLEGIIIKIGEYSFDIMALHFLVFKLVDYIYFVFNPYTRKDLDGFPTSNPELWPFYVILGVIIPVLIIHLFQETKFLLIKLKKLKNKQNYS